MVVSASNVSFTVNQGVDLCFIQSLPTGGADLSVLLADRGRSGGETLRLGAVQVGRHRG